MTLKNLLYTPNLINEIRKISIIRNNSTSSTKTTLTNKTAQRILTTVITTKRVEIKKKLRELSQKLFGLIHQNNI